MISVESSINLCMFFVFLKSKSKQLSILFGQILRIHFDIRNRTKGSFFWKLHLFVKILYDSRSIRRKLKRYGMQRVIITNDRFIHTLCFYLIFTYKYIFEKKNYCSLICIWTNYSLTLNSKENKKVLSICLLNFFSSNFSIIRIIFKKKKIKILYLKTSLLIII